MNLEKLASIAATVTLIAASAGHLPKMILAVRKAQVQLIQNTKASNWGLPMLLKKYK